MIVAEVSFNNGRFSIKHVLPETDAQSQEIFGLQTNEFHKVNLVCLTPNYWAGNSVGNKHYLFMLDGCGFSEPVRGFHNENLVSDLAQHRKVLEVLGSTCMIEPKGKHLAGIGFNATVRDELVLKLHGSHKRVVKIKF